MDDQNTQKQAESGKTVLDVQRLVKFTPDYPQRLLDTLRDKAPNEIYVKGNTDLLKTNAIGFSGGRATSDKGLAIVTDCTKQAVENNYTVVSGNARGTDFMAHNEALKSGGRTILVLPEGINNFKINHAMARNWDWNRTLVVSQFEPNAQWQGFQAMQRNGTIIGLSNAMIISEAGLQKGGTWAAGQQTLKTQTPLFVVKYGQYPESAIGNPELHKMGAHTLGASPENGRANMPKVFEEVNRKELQKDQQHEKTDFTREPQRATPSTPQTPPQNAAPNKAEPEIHTSQQTKWDKTPNKPITLPSISALPQQEATAKLGRNGNTPPIREITKSSPQYPQHLAQRMKENAPYRFYTQGNTDLLKTTGIAFFSSKDTSPKGLEIITDATKQATEKDITIITGNDNNADFTAQTEAQKNGGNSIIVLPAGIDKLEITKEQAQNWDWNRTLVISEFYPQDEKSEKNIPSRDQTIAALSKAVIVIEASHEGNVKNIARDIAKADILTAADILKSKTNEDAHKPTSNKETITNEDTHKPTSNKDIIKTAPPVFVVDYQNPPYTAVLNQSLLVGHAEKLGPNPNTKLTNMPKIFNAIEKQAQVDLQATARTNETPSQTPSPQVTNQQETTKTAQPEMER